MRIPFWDRAVRLLASLRAQPAKVRRARNRVLEAAREVGVLLIAFAPLDAAVADNQKVTKSLLLFLGLGCFLFLGALTSEWRRDDDV